MTQTATATKTLEILLCYCREDEGVKADLLIRLAGLEREGLRTRCHTHCIDAEPTGAASVADRIETADVVLLLISAGFVSSEYCYGAELQRAIQRHDAGDARVLPVILVPVFWKGTLFGRLPAGPQDGKPVSAWPVAEEALEDVAQSVLAAFVQQQRVAKESPREEESPEENTVSSRATVEAPRQDEPRPVVESPKVAVPVQVPSHRPAKTAQVRQFRKAFVSSTFVDLQKHRQVVIKSLRESGITVDPMEEWTAETDAPKQFSQDRMADCDLCILLVARRRGHIPKDESRSITQMEYDYAVAHDIAVLVFMLDDEAPWYSKYDESGSDPELARWRGELREKHGAGEFGLAPESLDISPALIRWIDKRQAEQANAPAKDCFELLVDLARNDPAVRDEVMKFRSVFKVISGQAKTLGDFKDLHDLLHQLQMGDYKMIVYSTNYFPDDATCAQLRYHNSGLQGTIERLQHVAARPSLGRMPVDWIDLLCNANKDLAQAIDDRDKAKLRSAIGHLQRVLATEPSKIDTRLNTLASQFQLGELSGALKAICEKTALSGLDSERIKRFETGAVDLDKLNHKLQKLVDAHYGWQGVDDSLRRIEDCLGNDPNDVEELVNSWDRIHNKIRALEPAMTQDQASGFRADAEKLASVMKPRNPAKIREYFLGYRARASQVFFETDTALHDLCIQLRAVGAPLDSILQVLG